MRCRFLTKITIYYCIAAGVATVACKSRTTESAQAKQNHENISFGGSGILGSAALFSDWYKRDTMGENSGSISSGGIGIAGIVPDMVINGEFKVDDGTSGTGGGGGRSGSGRPEDNGVPVPTDPFSKVCLGSGGEAFEKIQPLFCVNVPQPNKTDIVDKQAAIRLGKALFWDIQVGGDGQTACASCHFSGGADNRTTNTVHPGPNGVFEAPGITAAGQVFSPFKNIVSDDRAGSQGVVGAIFSGVNPDPNVAADNCTPNQDSPFFAHRRVTGRNTPSVIAAVFNQFNFWDGRANPVFNGYDPFGKEGNAGISQALSFNSSLASQAVGPANNGTEMSCEGRPFNGGNSLASKMLVRRPLRFQDVSKADSVLGVMSAFPDRGLNCYGNACTYETMIRDAFGASWVSLAQDHFSRLWGQALQAYMATLVPDQSRFDQYLSGKKSLFTPLMEQGLNVYLGQGECVDCHAGTETTDASVHYATLARHEDQGNDEGFHNLGVTLTEEDLGRASLGPKGVSWAQSNSKFNRGAFKTPSLRNLKLTAPYFHNGGKATLEDVVAFYAHRGGDFANPELTEELQSIEIEDSKDQAALVEFLREGLLDCRVEKYRAPFDHPSLVVPNGSTLPATGMQGVGSCRLNPAVPPTTVNCIKNPGICDSASALHTTSIYKDLTGRVPTSAEAYSHTRGGSTTIAAGSIRTLLGAPYNTTYELKILVEKLLARPLNQSLLANLHPNYTVMVQRIAALPEFKARAGGTVAGVVNLLFKQLAGRPPTPAELQAGIASYNQRFAVGPGAYVVNATKRARITDMYFRYFRRAPTAAEMVAAYRLVNDSDIAVILLLSNEYKAFSNARDDI